MKNSLLVLSAFVMHYSAFAQSKNDVSEELKETLISDFRSNTSVLQQNRDVQIITAQQIQKMPVKSVNELLAHVAGLDVRQRGPNGVQGDVGIDGGTFDQTLVLLDGVKVTDAQTGHNMMVLPIILEDIERIEVVRGASARIYGVNALLGVINIITKTAATNGVTAHANVGSSFVKDVKTQNVYTNYGVNARAYLSNEKVKQSLSLGINNGNGYRANTAFDQYKFNYKNVWHSTQGHRLQSFVGYTQNDFGANGFYAAPADSTSTEKSTTLLASVAYRRNLSERFKITPSVSYQYKTDDYKFKTNPTIGQNLHYLNMINAQLHSEILTSLGWLNARLDFRTELLNSSNLGEHQRNNFGLSLDYRFDKVKNVLVSFGAYANYNSDYSWKVYPGLDVSYKTSTNSNVYFNFGSGQRLPTFTDLYYQQRNFIVGNPNLKPESSVSFDLGYKWNNKLLRINANVFYREVSDFIDWVKADINEEWQPQNYQQVNTLGYRLLLNYQLLPREAIRNVGIYANYTHLNSEIQQTNDLNISRYAINSLKHQLQIGADIQLFSRWSILLQSRYQDRIKGVSYWLVDAKLQFKGRSYMIYVDCTNVFNQNYIEAGAAPLPGSWFSLGYRMFIND